MKRLKVSGGTVYQTNICSLWFCDGTGKGLSLSSDIPDCDGPDNCHASSDSTDTRGVPRGSVPAAYDVKGRLVGHHGYPK